MIFLYIFLIIISLILIILFSSLKLKIYINDDLTIKMKIWFVDINKLKDKKKKSKKPKKGKDTLLDIKNTIKQKGISDGIKEIKDSIIDILKKFNSLLSKAVIKKLNIKIAVSSEDAANAAIKYGVFCAAAYPIISYINTKAKVKSQDISIVADYVAEKTQTDIYLFVKIKIVHILIYIAEITIEKIKRNEENNNGKHTNKRNSRNNDGQAESYGKR